MKKIANTIPIVLILFVLCSCFGENETIVSETKSGIVPADSNAEDVSFQPYIITEPFVDNITPDKVDDDLFRELIYNYNLAIPAPPVPSKTNKIAYTDALDYMVYCGYFVVGENEIRSQFREDYSALSMYPVFKADAVDNYLCSIFNTTVDRSEIPRSDSYNFYDLYRYDADGDYYILYLQAVCFEADVIIRSIEKGEDGVYTIRADYRYSFIEETIDGEIEDYSYPIYDQIFKIQIKDGSFKYLSVEYLKIYSPEIEE